MKLNNITNPYRFIVILIQILPMLVACGGPNNAADSPSLAYDPDNDVGLPTAEPTSSPTPEITSTPGPDDVGSGVVTMQGNYLIKSDSVVENYDLGMEIPFEIFWNNDKQTWEAEGQSTRCDGIRSYELTDGSCACEAIGYLGDAYLKAVLIPPKTLIADPEGCKMTTYMTIHWQSYTLPCSGDCDSTQVSATVDTIEPVTIILKEGERATISRRQDQPFIVEEVFNFKLEKLDLPIIFGCIEPVEIELSP